jgi:ABC-type lipoprotein export system ATPase subunit
MGSANNINFTINKGKFVVFVFQLYNLIPTLTAFENVAFMSRRKKKTSLN